MRTVFASLLDDLEHFVEREDIPDVGPWKEVTKLLQGPKASDRLQGWFWNLVLANERPFFTMSHSFFQRFVRCRGEGTFKGSTLTNLLRNLEEASSIKRLQIAKRGTERKGVEGNATVFQVLDADALRYLHGRIGKNDVGRYYAQATRELRRKWQLIPEEVDEGLFEAATIPHLSPIAPTPTATLTSTSTPASAPGTEVESEQESKKKSSLDKTPSQSASAAPEQLSSEELQKLVDGGFAFERQYPDNQEELDVGLWTVACDLVESRRGYDVNELRRVVDARLNGPNVLPKIKCRNDATVSKWLRQLRSAGVDACAHRLALMENAFSEAKASARAERDAAAREARKCPETYVEPSHPTLPLDLRQKIFEEALDGEPVLDRYFDRAWNIVAPESGIDPESIKDLVEVFGGATKETKKAYRLALRERVLSRTGREGAKYVDQVLA